MKLDRNINPDGRGKYALIEMRKLGEWDAAQIEERGGKAGRAITLPAEAVNDGCEPGQEFFVIKYKDEFAEPALRAYAAAVRERAKYSDPRTAPGLYEYAAEIDREADAAMKHPAKQIPD